MEAAGPVRHIATTSRLIGFKHSGLFLGGCENRDRRELLAYTSVHAPQYLHFIRFGRLENEREDLRQIGRTMMEQSLTGAACQARVSCRDSRKAAPRDIENPVIVRHPPSDGYGIPAAARE